MKNMTYKKWAVSVAAAALCSMGLSAAAAQDGVVLSDITAVTYVGDNGEMVEAFEVTVDDADKIEGLTADDISVTQSNNEGTETTDLAENGRIAFDRRKCSDNRTRTVQNVGHDHGIGREH